VTVQYGAALALDDVTLEVRAGEMVSLLGGNASGKSTTLKTLLGIVSPSKGRVEFEGQDINKLSPAERVRSGIALVPENRELFPRLTVRENLMLGGYTVRRQRTAKAQRDELERILELFPRVSERLGQAAGTLSGGEQQMVAIGRALMSVPRVLLMDEPSMGLSPALVKQSFQLIKMINSAGVTTLVVEQNARAALAVADRGYVLQSGKIVLAGTADELLNDADLQRAYLG
jgi:branched-chain amino acid transport system ATP-binding protein